eukprot:TRINITY_DN14563_c0_g1_i3.p1 TRINITY_DN14563_c0_g1~~TRINITY_DN14563_c0_g1_i3.p1  ORF type:complete len:130 (-),score=40.07 TRINITY_DN14563_c0_g1_i3:224-613(-)
MIRRPPRSTLSSSSAASDVYKRQSVNYAAMEKWMTESDKAATGPTLAQTSQYLYKPMSWDQTTAAVLIMNHGSSASDLTLKFSDIPGITCNSCKLRDVWAKKDIGSFDGSYTATSVGSHDTAFFIVSPA